MESRTLNKSPLCQLPQRQIEVNDCSKTHPKINIAEEILNAPRSCQTVSFSNVHSTEFGFAGQNKLRQFFSEFEEFFKNFTLLPEWLRKIMNNILRKLIPEKHNSDHISDFVETRDWSTSSIRCMAWHPHVFKLAIASSEDYVRVYDNDGIQSPIIKDKLQKLITCIAWRPFAINEMAIGCKVGIIFWFTDIPKENMLHAKILKHKHHWPVTALEWRADGLVLASASINDSNILLWNVDTEEFSPIRRFKPKCCFIRWAPKTLNLFCATTDRVFRVWSVKNVYNVERWVLKSGRVQSAAWSPCGQILLFVTDNDTLLYRLQQISNSPFLISSKQWQAIPVADLNTIFIENLAVGGLVQSLVWDQRGLFVALSFKETNFVAVFLTNISGEEFFIAPHEYISGRDGEYPISLCFQNVNSFNKNVVLTIGWSNGLVKFYLLRGF